MSRLEYELQALWWRAVARLVPTCFLQEALAEREGVWTAPIRIGETAELAVEGPCIVTVNRN